MKHPLRAVLAVVALLLLLSLDHGLPHRYLPDDTTVRCALGIAQDLTSGEVPLLEALFPPGNRYTTYPMLLPYLDLAALGGRFAVGLALGDWSGPGSFKAAVFEDPGVAWFPARLVAALLALLVPWGLYRACRELGRPKGEAALAGLLGGTSLLLVQYAHTSRPWAPMLGLAALSLALTLRLLRKRTPRSVLAAWVAGALPGAAFQVGLLFLPMPAVGTLILVARTPPDHRRQALLTALRGLAAGTVVLCLLGYPHLLIHSGETAADGMGGAAAREPVAEEVVGLGGQELAVTAFSTARIADVSRQWFGYEPVLLVCGGLGLVLLLGWRRRAETGLLIVAPALCFAALFLFYDGTHVRYLMPATMLLAPGAAALLVALARRGGVGRALAVALLTVPLVQAVRLDQLLGREDTRTVAARELLSVIGEDERVALDGMGSRYGPPLLAHPAALAEQLADGCWLNRTEQRILEGGSPPPGARHLLAPARCWRFDSYYASDFLYDGLSEEQHRQAGRRTAADGRPIQPVAFADWLVAKDIDVFVQVDRVPDAARRQPVTDVTDARGTLVWELSPSGAPDPVEATLPTDLDFALTSLWRLERPGPWIRAWRLAPPAGEPR